MKIDMNNSKMFLMWFNLLVELHNFTSYLLPGVRRLGVPLDLADFDPKLLSASL